MAALEITQGTFTAQVMDVKDKPVLVDFWAPWCGPCRLQGPIVDELAAEAGNAAVIGKVNVDENQDLAGKYAIMSIPALLVFKNGQVVENMVGVHQKDALKKILEKHA